MVIARPSGGSVKGLLDLPAELCLRVFDFLPDQAPADLAALARTCKALWLPAVRALYRRIRLNPETDSHRCDFQKLVRFLRLIHTLLLGDKPFLSMTEQLCIDITDPIYLSDWVMSISPETSVYSDTVYLSAAIGRHIGQVNGRPGRLPIDWRDIVELILQRSPNLRCIDYFGYTEWDFTLDHCRKLEILYLHSPKLLNTQRLAKLAPIPDLKSLQLPPMQIGWRFGEYTFTPIPQDKFPSLLHLKILDFPNTSSYAPDFMGMVPTLQSLELQWTPSGQGVRNFISCDTLSSVLDGTHISSTGPKPSLGETLERMRVHTTWWDMDMTDSRIPIFGSFSAAVQLEKKNVMMWNEKFFGSLKFLRSLKLLEIPLLAPVNKIIHLLPESLEELHLTDENLFLFDVAKEFERLSAVLPRLGPTAGLYNMKGVFLKFQRFDPSPCQQIMDRMKEICQESDIRLNVILNYVPENEWGLKEN